MPLSLLMPTSPIFSQKKLPSIYCKSEGSSFHSSPRINGSHAPSYPLSVSLSPTKSPCQLPSASLMTSQSPSSPLKYPLSICVPKIQLPFVADTKPYLVKGKRPGRIEIPTLMAVQLGLSAGTPRGDEEVRVEAEGYSVYCKRGRRGKMEDRYSAAVDLDGDPKQAFFGVYDGHGGSRAAEFVSKNLDKKVMAEVSKTGEDAAIDHAIREAYLTTDTDVLKEDLSGGTCCVTVMIRKGNLFVSNAGDCRAVLSRNGVAEALTSDHHPSRQDERDRIEALGGYVDRCHGVWRIQGSLAVSRSIGDKHLKQWVIAEPETKMLEINSEFEFLILASDGLWNKVTNQEAIDFVRPFCVGLDNPNPFPACKKLVELSSWRGSFDDISVMIIPLQHFAS
ncbi:putative protein phosphatase 2C 25 [Hibiscus syriacus]|uniref:protein-serine/threonine phosphatase n=1 Tax=Hibiscus syriacus TaxID=106335 RepID=A0A6A2Y1Y4_HIBSY|nr:probable protein phosphatase 2C 25 [Hibiscus syriacus]KAE8669366.1 putative protein phosphatase 2C 25 [Hibiscus syriacus]